MKYLNFTLLIMFFHTILFSQTPLESLFVERKNIETEIAKLKETLEAKTTKLDQLKKEIATLELDKLKASGFKISVGAKEPYLLEGENSQIGRLQQNEEITIMAYATNIERIKVYSPSLDKIGYIVPLVFGSNDVVQAFIEKPENRIEYKKPENKIPAKTTGTKTGKNTRNSSKSSNHYVPKRTPSRVYHRGPRGGCYYYNSNGKKTYVKKHLCN